MEYKAEEFDENVPVLNPLKIEGVMVVENVNGTMVFINGKRVEFTLIHYDHSEWLCDEDLEGRKFCSDLNGYLIEVVKAGINEADKPLKIDSFYLKDLISDVISENKGKVSAEKLKSELNRAVETWLHSSD